MLSAVLEILQNPKLVFFAAKNNMTRWRTAEYWLALFTCQMPSYLGGTFGLKTIYRG